MHLKNLPYHCMEGGQEMPDLQCMKHQSWQIPVPSQNICSAYYTCTEHQQHTLESLPMHEIKTCNYRLSIRMTKVSYHFVYAVYPLILVCPLILVY